MSDTRITFSIVFLSVIVTFALSDDLFRNTDCNSKLCQPSNYSTLHELRLIKSVVIEARSDVTDNFEASVPVSVQMDNTPSYLGQTIETSEGTDKYFHVNSGFWIYQYPLLGNGLLHNISLNISHGGVIQVYSMGLYESCDRFNMFWRCMDNSTWLIENNWGSDISKALDELEFLSAGLLEETFYVVNSADVLLPSAGNEDLTIDFMIQKGNFLAFESVNATLICNKFDPVSTIEYVTYETPIWSKFAPFFSLNLEYKSYQPYELKFDNLIKPFNDSKSLDIASSYTLNATNGTVSIEGQLNGYFSSYLVTFKIPEWDVLYKDHDSVSFNLLAIINGNLIGLPNTSMALNNIINMPPPARILLSESIVSHPERSFNATLHGKNDKELLFIDSVTSYRWMLSVLPSNASIRYSSDKIFEFNDFVMPGNYRVSLEFDTIDKVTFTTFADIEYVSDAFTFIKCLLNCDPSFTTGHVKLQLSVNVPILALLNYEIVSAKWSVTEQDTSMSITSNVTLFDDLIEISIDTSVLTKKDYVVDLVIATLGSDTAIHDDYKFNMSYPDYSLPCSIDPPVGISMQTAHEISCILSINNLPCYVCEGTEGTLCDLCNLNYTYYFKFCVDHSDCNIQSPLVMGNFSEPTATGILLPVGNELDSFNLRTIVCMYDEKGGIEYVHELTTVISKPDPSLAIDDVLNDAVLALDNRAATNEEVFSWMMMVSMALSHTPEVYNETHHHKQAIDFVKKAEHWKNNDISLSTLPALYLLSKMNVSDNITEELSSLTNKTYQSIDAEHKEEAKSAGNAMLSIIWNVVESNAEVSNVEEDIPELNLYFQTESPDKAYYNKWVAFDIEEESKSNADSTRSSAICSTLQTLQDYVAQYLKKGSGLGEVTSLNLQNVDYYLGRLTAPFLTSGYQLVGTSFVKVPPPQFTHISYADTLSISFVKFSSNPCILTKNSDRIKSAVVGINITDSSQQKVVKSFQKPLEVLVPLKGQKSLQEFLYKPENDWLYLQLDIYAKPYSALFLQILTTRKTTLLMKYGRFPKILDHDMKFEIPNLAADKLREDRFDELGFSPWQNQRMRTIQVPLKSNGTYFIGARVDGNKVRRFWLLPYMTSCLKWEGDGWSISSENVGILSNSTCTHCKFDELSLYAADVSYPNLTEYKQPRPEEELMSRALESLEIWIPLIFIYGYLLLIVTYVLRLQDRDLRSTNLLHLLSSKETKHSYKIDVKTGLRPKAGTTSQVYLEFHGSKAHRKVKIKQNDGDLFQTNQTSTFLFYSDVNMGRIDRIYVWIDYSGNYPDWFLESVKITDSKDHVSMFLYNNWIGYDIERYACCIQRYLPSEVPLIKRLVMSLVECMVNYHSCISNLFKGTRTFPPRTYLTSLFVLRCLTLLCLVVLNFKDNVKNEISSTGMWKLIFLLLSTYPVFFLLEKWQELLHKNERHNFLVSKKLNRHVSESSVQTFDLDKYFWVTASEKSKNQDIRKISTSSGSLDDMDDYFNLTSKANLIKPEVARKSKDPDYYLSTEEIFLVDNTDTGYGKTVKVDDYFKLFWDKDNSDNSSVASSSVDFDKYMKKPAAPPPVSFKFSSRKLRKFLVMFCYISIVAATCFYLFYTYMGKTIHMQACLIHFFTVIVLMFCVEQPMVCGVMTLVYSSRLWYGYRNPDAHCDTLLNTEGTEENVTKHPEIKTWLQKIIKRRKMNTVVVKLFSYIAFIVIVVVLSKHDRQTNCYYLNTSVRNIFATPEFENIETKADFWKWIQYDYSSTLSSKDFYKNTMSHVKIPKENYLKDGSSIIISISRLKQVRIRTTTCSNRKEGLCNEVYSRSLIEKQNFDPSWKEYTPAAADAWFSTIRYKSYWQYHDEGDGVEIRGNAGLYPAGGYKVPLANSPHNAKRQLQILERDGWIDELTRAAFVELSVYNPPTGFLCTVKLITEFLPTGNVISSAQLHSINFLKYSKPITLSTISTELVYLTSLLILSAHYVYNMYLAHQKGHSMWRGFWTLLDSVTLGVGWASVCMYVYRYNYIQTAIAQFQATPYYYIDFHRAAEVDIYFGYCLGALVFLVTVKIVDLTIAHVKIKLMTLVIHNSLVELSSFGVPFFILLSVFSQTFYCLYSSTMPEFSNIQSSFGQTFAFILGEYNWDAMIRVRPYLTPFLGLLLGLLSITYLANMFAVIVCYNTTNIRMNPPTTRHLAIFSYLSKTIQNVVFFLVPLFGDMYNVIKRNLPGNEEQDKSSEDKALSLDNSDISASETSAGTSGSEKETHKPAPAAVKTVQNDVESVKLMRWKLKRQTKTLRDLKNLLARLESRLEKFPGC